MGVFSGGVIAKRGARWRCPESNSVVVLGGSNSCGYRTDKYTVTVRRLLLRYYYCNIYTTAHSAYV